MKLFESTRTLIDKTKNGENVTRLEVIKIVLIQCKLVDKQHQQKPEILYTFMP